MRPPADVVATEEAALEQRLFLERVENERDAAVERFTSLRIPVEPGRFHQRPADERGAPDAVTRGDQALEAVDTLVRPLADRSDLLRLLGQLGLRLLLPGLLLLVAL